MKNKYWTKRHYKATEDIKNSVSKMNKDIQELSSYCDELEGIIDKQQKQINKYLEAVSMIDAYRKGNENVIGMLINLDYLSRTLKGDPDE